MAVRTHDLRTHGSGAESPPIEPYIDGVRAIAEAKSSATIGSIDGFVSKEAAIGSSQRSLFGAAMAVGAVRRLHVSSLAVR